MVEYLAAGIQALGLVYGVVSGERQAGVQRQARRDQEKAQDDAMAATVREARTAEEEANRARQRSPDVDVLLGDQQRRAPGPNSIDADRLLLGRPGLLGV